MLCDIIKSCNHNTSMNIDQTVSDVDQLTCMANTLLQSIAAACGINIDYNGILKCNSAAIDSMLLPEESMSLIQQVATCKKIEDSSFDKEDFLNRAKKAFKTLKFFMNSSSGLKAPIKCNNDSQSANGDPCDPNACYVTLKYRLLVKKYRNRTKLSDDLCENGPIMCSLDAANFPSDFHDWLNSVQKGQIPPPYIYQLNETPRPLTPKEKMECSNILKIKHAILLIGSNCVTINGQTYIEYTFKDTYNTSYGQVTWKLRIPISHPNQSYLPFTPGMSHPFSSSNITGVKVTNCDEVKEAYERCCETCYWECEGGSQMWVKTAGCDNCVDANLTLECNEDNSGATTLTLCLDD